MSRQGDFASALLDPQQACPDNLSSWNGAEPSSRFAVYRNNVISSLVTALGESFPVVEQLVGAEFFASMARLYIREAPPRTRILAEYGAAFPGFIQNFPPAAGLPYLADVARLEFLRTQAYHAADAPTLDAAQLGAALAEPDRLPALQLHVQPSLGLLSSAFAIVSLWAAHQGLLTIGEVDPQQPEHALILRQGLQVQVQAIAPGTAAFARALQHGLAFAEAAEQALQYDPDFDLGAQLAHLLNAGALSGYSFAH